MHFNIADIFELAVDRYSDRDFLVCDAERRTFAEMEARANQLAHHLAAKGIGKDDHVGVYATNCVEWVETIFATAKIRAVFVNINYRYVAEELAYIFDNADLKAVVVQRQYLPLLNELRDTLPKLEHVLVVEDSSEITPVDLQYLEYEAALAGESTERDFGPRADDDRYLLYTGGTTGMPKGVVWNHRDVIFALGGGVDQMTQIPVERPEEIVDRGKDGGMTVMSIAPLMHGATQWSTIGRAFEGNKIVLMSHFDPVDAWQLIEREGVNSLFIVGDAMGRPLIEALNIMDPAPDTSSLFVIASSGAVFSPSIKDQFLERFPDIIMVDSIGASEVGGNGMTIVKKGETAMSGGGPTVTPMPGTVVLDTETLEIIPPGDARIGKVARSGFIPREYYKDPVKSAETYVTTKDGIRYSIPGDFARVEADGRITMLGRGSVCINSGGEKIFPEEVESACKALDAIFDCVVVGVPDDKWGSRVAVVAQPRGDTRPDIEALQAHCRTKIAGYKIPRELHWVDEIPRSPAGKPNYAWAKDVAMGN